MRSTKIVCTIGPACSTQEKMEEMLRAGMNVARMNFSHGDHAMHLANLENFRRAREAVGVPAAVLLDTRGPEIRTLPMEGEIMALEGEKIILSPGPADDSDHTVAITYPRLSACVRPGNRVLIDDGRIALRVEKIEGALVHTVVENGGAIRGYKGINLPGVAVDLPFLSDKDKADLRFAAEHDVDYIAASFTRTAQDLRQMRAYLDVIGAQHIRIIAKIENRQGIANFDEILAEADGIMVARGDMGVEIEYERLPGLQKNMITRCRLAGKPTITATQMLESMITHPTPTRAEVSDVANAVFDGTSAVMLSGETAAGQYPVQSIETMARIVARAEQDMPEGLLETVRDRSNVSVALCDAACTTARDLGAVALVAVTRGGVTARDMSAFRPRIPILALTPEEKTYQQLALSHGVIPLRSELQNDEDELFIHIMQVLGSSGYVKSGDRVVIAAGLPIGESGSTNTIKVKTVQ